MDAKGTPISAADSQNNDSPSHHREQLVAYGLPFLVFMLFLAASGLISRLATDLISSSRALFLVEPDYWLYPLQTVVCGFLVWKYRRRYIFNGLQRPLFSLAIGLLVLALWIAPQWLFGAERRIYGFDPTVFDDRPFAYWATVIMRFVRLVVVVPLVEEIFWRGFLMRYLIDDRFTRIPIGTFSWKSFLGVAFLFSLAHAGPDFGAALVTGLIYNWLLLRTRSVGSCTFAHAVTNFGLGLYIMATQQWGFW